MLEIAIGKKFSVCAVLQSASVQMWRLSFCKCLLIASENVLWLISTHSFWTAPPTSHRFHSFAFMKNHLNPFNLVENVIITHTHAQKALYTKRRINKGNGNMLYVYEKLHPHLSCRVSTICTTYNGKFFEHLQRVFS